MAIDTIILCFVIFYLLYKYFNRNFDYWERIGVPCIKPRTFFGNYYDILTFRKTVGHALADMYNEIVGPYFGIWILNTPHFIVKSPELIKLILVKDFKYFHDRTVVSNEKVDPITASVLFMLKGPEWKVMRTKMTPVFTSGKIKSMIPLINRAGEDLKSYLLKEALKYDSLEAKEICAKYATDVVTSCAFGVDGDSFKSENATWRAVGREMFEFSVSNGFRNSAYFFLPKMVDLFKIKFMQSHIATFMREVFWQTVHRRERDSITRNDVIDVIMKLIKEGNFDGIKFEGDKVVAQAAQFFFAGFETTAATISYTLYELSLNKSIQMKLISEIKSNLKEHEEVTYDDVQNMKYLHKVIQETLRKYPVLPFLDRRCVMDYKIPDTNVVLEKGTPVYIPMFGLHYDPEYYPNPDLYDPERFSEENINTRPSLAYLPFGSGPHNCLGERFGLISTKLALVHILSQFEVERSSETPVPIEFEPKSLTLASKVGLPLRFVKTEQ